MNKFLSKYKRQILAIMLITFLGIIYFSYNITTTWDSSEYLGLADYIGTEQMTENWIGHRGIAFPLLLKLFKPFGIENKIFMLILMFIFYVAMIAIIYKIYKKLDKHDFFKNKVIKYIFAIYIIFSSILNPIIFGYYHTLLTEFVSMTITLLMCYLSWKWIDFNWEDDKKIIIIYAVIFSLLTIILYHMKQSLVPLAILPILTALIVSVINNCKLSNFLTKLVTIFSVVIMLVTSISIWNITMKDANVAEDTGDARIKGYLIKGIIKLEEVCNNQDINDIEFDRTLISDKDNEQINKILSNESKYDNFRIYKTSNEKYIVHYIKGDYSFKDDIKFYFKVLSISPGDIIKSYYKNYWYIVFFREDLPIWIGKENYTIPYRIYQHRENVVDVNKGYEQYIENYRSINETNIISKTFNIYAKKMLKIITVFTKISLWILPITWIISIIVYIIINRKVSKDTLKILQFIVLLYTTSFGSIMSYVIFAANIDRYTVPIMIPTFIAHFLSIVLLMRIDIKKKDK